MQQKCEVKVRYFPIPPSLARYCTIVYYFELSVADGGMVEDWLFPEWATMRFHTGDRIEADTSTGSWSSSTTFLVNGPRSESVRFRIGSLREWGFGLNPLGWARFIGLPAGDFTNGLYDGYEHPAFQRFRPLARNLFGERPEPEMELAKIFSFLTQLDLHPVAQEQAIFDIFLAVHDPGVLSVRQLADRVGMGQRTLERVCRHVFGFPPKLLLRRQRFMRSLNDYNLDPSLKWIGAMDALYHDQAQFVRDFRKFMGMKPSEYTELDRPILETITRERMRHAREVVRSLRAQGDTREYGISA